MSPMHWNDMAQRRAIREQTGELRSATWVANHMSVRIETIYRWARSGKLEGVHVGRQWRFTPEAVAAMKQARITKTSAA